MARRNQTKTPRKNAGNNKSAPAEQRGAPTQKKELPKKFPFWARLKFGKRRTTLVIDEAPARDKQKKTTVPGYVHREATHTEGKDVEKIEPNPDRTDPEPMYLKRPKKTPKRLFEPHNKNLIMPEELEMRYAGNNYKGNKK